MRNEKYLLSIPLPSPEDLPDLSKDPLAITEYISRWSNKKPDSPVNYLAELVKVDGKAGQPEHTILMLTFYEGKSLVYRMFQDNVGRIGFAAKDMKASKASLDYLVSNWNSVFTSSYVRGSAESYQIIKDYIEARTNEKAMGSFIRFQESLAYQKIKARNDKIRQSTDEKMLEITLALPEDFFLWIKNSVMKKSHYIFYDYAPKKKVKGICSECHRDVVIKRPRHEQKGCCPACKKPVIFLAKGKVKKKIMDQERVAYISKTKSGYVTRLFVVAKKYDTDIWLPSSGEQLWPLPQYLKHKSEPASYRFPEYEIVEVTRQFRSSVTARYDENYYYGQLKGKYGLMWCKDYTSGSYSYNHLLYAKNLKQVFGTDDPSLKGLQYFPFNDFGKSGVRVDVWKFINDILENPQIEYLAKAKLYSLAVDPEDFHKTQVFDINAKRIHQFLRIEKEQLSTLQRLDPTSEELLLFQRCIQYGYGSKVASQAIKKIRELDLTPDFFSRIAEIQNPVKAAEYIERQWTLAPKKLRDRSGWGCRYGSIYSVKREYEDYIMMAKKNKYDMKSSFVLWPKSIMEAHDIVTELDQNRRTKERESKYKIIKRRFARENKLFAYEQGGYFIRMIKSYEELCEEGRELRHCVGTYAEKVADSLIEILVMRSCSEPEKALLTIEYSGGEIKQARGFGNRTSSKEESNWIKKWEKEMDFRKARNQTSRNLKTAVSA